MGDQKSCNALCRCAPEAIELDIKYEDDDLIVVNKARTHAHAHRGAT